MADSKTARVIDSSANLAVVQLDGRRFPGIVVQGDALIALVREVRRGQAELEAIGISSDSLDVIDEALTERLVHYLQVLKRRGIEPPSDISGLLPS